MNHEDLKKRVERLEEEHGVNPVEAVMWSVSDAGIFGHTHVKLSVKGTEKRPCTDDEEIAIMRNAYERDKQRIWGKGEEVPFHTYLETFTYLAPEGLAERQRVAIDKLKEP